MLKIRNHLAKDIPLRVKWLNNPNVNRYIGEEESVVTTLAEQKKWFANYRKAKNKKFFTICEDKKPIGFMGLSNISRSNNNADLFIAIGEDDCRGVGMGKSALIMLLNYGFDELNLHKINLGVIEGNASAIGLYKTLGFKVEGEMKDEVFRGGKFHNLLSMAIFAKDWKKKEQQ